PVVLKPASQTPLSSFLIADFFHRAGLPKGALNVVTGKGSVIGNSIVTDPRTNVITFTGSLEVGNSLKSKAGLKKVT
ncbi:aldehyde dehydrogenase family protein, partial [Pseudomonas sp. 2995-3]|uniref:aldehyde dehydrogenase family protein n=1 Tax=Pseudomonas sp. 2995-3 TaxID=1712680 RepID=UPI00117AF96C